MGQSTSQIVEHITAYHKVSTTNHPITWQNHQLAGIFLVYQFTYYLFSQDRLVNGNFKEIPGMLRTIYSNQRAKVFFKLRMLGWQATMNGYDQRLQVDGTWSMHTTRKLTKRSYAGREGVIEPWVLHQARCPLMVILMFIRVMLIGMVVGSCFIV